ncbi:hypothetical protein [Sphingomonas sp.]|uniref:hypothetical protein n=1 Tax=Sphingomonas sp. TaxID=28214 RepID=UPI0025CBB7B1|nr:hypothetical protein [Sphingomonas sp.]
MQGKLIVGTFLIATLGSPSVAAVQQPPRQTCSKGEQPQQVQQRQQWAQQQPPRNKPQGCPITRSIPSVVDPTPTFLL